MQRSLLNRCSSLFLLLLFTLLAGVPDASSQVRFAPEAVPSPLAEVMQTGRKLEEARRWGEALTHYEQALREHPGQENLRVRLNLSKIHYDLGRRYSDDSFKASLRQLGEQESLNLYSEILLKLNSHYVNSPQWHKLVVRGTTSLDVALTEPEFQQLHLQHVQEDQINTFRQSLYQLVGRYAIRSRHDARNIVANVGRLAQKQLGVSPTVAIMEYTCGAMGGLDDYSTFLTPDQLREIYSQIEGNFVGLGIEIKADSGDLLLVHVIKGSPAQRAGLVAGDRIVAVEGQAVSDLNTDQAASMLQGKEGSYVLIDAKSTDGTVRRHRIRREHVDVPSIEDVKILEASSGIAYLKLSSFQKNTVRDLDSALWSLHRKGMRSLIMDLRGNPGGLLTTAVEIGDRFIQEGVIVSTKGRSPQEDFVYRAHRAGTWRVPLVVLIDENSASASEIFAGAIRDSQRGTIVGTRSYGKGSVQGIFPLNVGGSGVRLTTAKFYSPSGRAISKVGVSPDIVVRTTAKPVAGTHALPREVRDAALNAARQAAQRQFASR